ncbi:thermonuclease family protein [Rhizobium laguerreae]|uniref:thermonuclease family protein n=1 Tax=Rhizobium laguerreae TaxID=1076926 RepID=UPI0035E44CAD
MKFAVIATALLSRLTFALVAQTPSGPAAVIDGDTVDIAGARIRLSGIDAPESWPASGRFGISVWRRGGLALLAPSGVEGRTARREPSVTIWQGSFEPPCRVRAWEVDQPAGGFSSFMCFL